jgi:hypothetical protein
MLSFMRSPHPTEMLILFLFSRKKFLFILRIWAHIDNDEMDLVKG